MRKNLIVCILGMACLVAGLAAPAWAAGCKACESSCEAAGIDCLRGAALACFTCCPAGKTCSATPGYCIEGYPIAPICRCVG